jgi:hypothetical protein
MRPEELRTPPRWASPESEEPPVPEYIAGPLVLGGLRLAIKLGKLRQSRHESKLDSLLDEEQGIPEPVERREVGEPWSLPTFEQGDIRTRGQKRLKRKIDNLSHGKMRGAMVNDLAHLRHDIPQKQYDDPITNPTKNPYPDDPHPEIAGNLTGNKPGVIGGAAKDSLVARRKVDELLTRRGIIDTGLDATLPPIALGTPEHRDQRPIVYYKTGLASSERTARTLSKKIDKRNKKIDKLASEILGIPDQASIDKELKKIDRKITRQERKLARRQTNNTELEQIYAALDNDSTREDRQDARYKRAMQKGYGRFVNRINDKGLALEQQLMSAEGCKELGQLALQGIQVAGIKLKKRLPKKKTK